MLNDHQKLIEKYRKEDAKTNEKLVYDAINEIEKKFEEIFKKREI